MSIYANSAGALHTTCVYPGDIFTDQSPPFRGALQTTRLYPGCTLPSIRISPVKFLLLVILLLFLVHVVVRNAERFLDFTAVRAPEAANGEQMRHRPAVSGRQLFYLLRKYVFPDSGKNDNEFIAARAVDMPSSKNFPQEDPRRSAMPDRRLHAPAHR